MLCRHFGTCGGCAYQNLPSEKYRVLKREIVERALARHGLSQIHVEPPVEVPPATRRRATLKAVKQANAIRIGFHAARSHDIVDMQECRVLTPALFGLIPALREFAGAVLIDGEEASFSLTDCVSGIDIACSLKRAVDPRGAVQFARWAQRNHVARVSVNGETVIQLAPAAIKLADVEIDLSVGSFLQPTVEGERYLQEFVRDCAQGAKRIADLFAGCGTFTFTLAGRARVHAVDSDKAALAALATAARKARKLKPVTTEPRDLAKRPLHPDELNAFDSVVLDPPRAGALAQARALAASRVGRVVYVSCNPETFARDALVLVDAGFRVAPVHPIDQFVWSSHIELAAVFSRR